MSSTKISALIRSMLLPALFLAASMPGAADDRLDRLPEKYRDWLEKEVVYIITDKERDAFLDLQSVDEWQAFIEAFWRNRDPDPLTPVNEFKEEHYRRLEYANTALGRDSAVPGWMTDRGKMYIILGEPDDRDSFRSVPGLYPAELWFYLGDRDKALPPLYLLFFQEHNAGPYRLFNHVMDGPEKLIPVNSMTLGLSRMEAYQQLQTFSPDLAHASVTFRADRGGYGNVLDTESSALDSIALLGDIYTSPYRRVDTRYVDAAGHNRGLVESEYLFNYIPSKGTASVIAGPHGARFVHYSLEIEPQHLTLGTDGENYYTTFELSGEVTTPDGETILRLAKERYLSLTKAEFERVSHRPLAYRSMFPLVAGDYNFRMVLKNRARSEYTIFETPLRVPERGSNPGLGDPVLLYELASLPTTTETGTEDHYRAYEIGALELEPDARRLYAVGDDLAVYLPIENVDAGDRISLRIESLDPAGAPGAEQPATTRKMADYGDYDGAVVESLSTEGLVGGRYQLVATLEDATGNPIETRNVGFDITPLTVVARPWAISDSMDGNDGGAVLASLAEQYENLGELAEARDAYLRALGENPNLSGARVFLAHVALDNDKAEEAVQLLEPVLDNNRNDFQLLVTLGDAYVRTSRFDRASELFEAAIVLRRPDTTLLNALAACHAKLGNLDKAREYLERSLELDPKQEKVEYLLEQLRASASRQGP
jgi:GWxTD domain-containing protein